MLFRCQRKNKYFCVPDTTLLFGEKVQNWIYIRREQFELEG